MRTSTIFIIYARIQYPKEIHPRHNEALHNSRAFVFGNKINYNLHPVIEEIKDTTIELSKENIHSVGGSNDLHYLSATYTHKKQERNLVIFFADKPDEIELQNTTIKIIGTFSDSGSDSSPLVMVEAKIAVS